jgi:hypothetical protein
MFQSKYSSLPKGFLSHPLKIDWTENTNVLAYCTKATLSVVEKFCNVDCSKANNVTMETFVNDTEIPRLSKKNLK